LNQNNPPISYGTFSKDVIPEKIAKRILSLIKEKQLKPGDRLPSERDLAAMMGISRPSLREALRALSILNIIEIRQGDGTFVTSLDTALLVEPLEFIFSLDYSTFFNLFEARKILELGIIALAAKRITSEEILRMEACLNHSKENIHNHEVFVQNDIELHDLIAQAAKNPILYRFAKSISKLGEVSRSKTVEIPGVPEQTTIDHENIISALKKRDSFAAEEAMLAHLANVERKLKVLSDDS
jgi:GntR family transcriptional regulator, transcriptional repressor for pyruvate dehydrogenase complex